MISQRLPRSSHSSTKTTTTKTSSLGHTSDESEKSSSISLLPPTSAAIPSNISNKRPTNWFVPIILLLILFMTDLRSGTEMMKSSQLSSADDSSYHNSAAICAIQKGALRYIDEWVYYNLLGVGFDHIYVYDNSDDFELEAWHSNLTNQIGKNQQDTRTIQQRVSIQHFLGPNRQNEAYTACTKRIQKTKAHSWIAFFDVDEFVVLRNRSRYSNIMDLLNTLPSDQYAGLAVNWIVIGMNQQNDYQPVPVTMRFPKRAANATDTHIKTIARTERIDYVNHPHFVIYEKKGQYLNRHYHSLVSRLRMSIWELCTGPMIVTRDTQGKRILQAWNVDKVVDDIALYHYHTKSLEEYKERCSRGRADIPLEDWKEQLPCQPEEVIKAEYWNRPETIVDDMPWQVLRERVPSYAYQFANIAW